MKGLRHPARPVFHNESDVDVTIHPDEESDAEEVDNYHMVTGANRQLHRQSSQKPKDTVGIPRRPQFVKLDSQTI